MSNILILLDGEIIQESGITNGTGIRALEVAKALKRKKNKVLIAETKHKKDYSIHNINIRQWDKKKIKKLVKNKKVVIFIPGIPNSSMIYNYFENIKIPTIIDLHDPFYINSLFKKNRKENSDLKNYMCYLLKKGDFFICSNERQRYFYQGVLASLGRLGLKEIVSIVPMGIPIEKPKKKKLKGIINGKIILWPGEFYPWFDPLTAINALELVVKKYPNTKMLFVGADYDHYNKYLRERVNNIKNHIKKKKINKHIVFIDWLPYNKRETMYNTSDISVITYFNTIENQFSFRTRVLDCVWGNLPVICTEGDYLSEIIKNEGFGEIVKEKDYKKLAYKIIKMLDNKPTLNKNLIAKFHWDNIIKPINDFCNNPFFSYHEQISLETSVEYFIRLEKKKNELKEIKKRKNQLIYEKNESIKDIKKKEKLKIKCLRKREKEKGECLKKKIKDREKEINEKEKEIQNLKNDVNSIINSKGYKYVLSNIWKVYNKISIKRKIKK